jgi:2-keto-4-pentenoate hydratase/2-oxohepta-3-ene-1,7-dioic acid hydratase in catechol pathway
MRLATIHTPRGLRPALLDGGLQIDLEDALSATGHRVAALDAPPSFADPANVLGLLRGWDEALPVLEEAAAQIPALVRAGAVQPAGDARLGPPVPRPGKIICVGLNYADHAAETGQPVPKSPILFTKFATCVVGARDDVVRPFDCTDLDYEAELGVVIGRVARHVPVSAALGFVAGYCCANDVSARTAQLGDGQWMRGKSYDTFCPLGPMLAAGAVPDPQALRIGCRVDGESRQDSTTAQMVFGVAELIAFCSRAFTLEPGDVILTGTPPGVAMGRDPSPWLQPGQVCEVWIEGLDGIANRIVGEAVQPG